MTHMNKKEHVFSDTVFRFSITNSFIVLFQRWFVGCDVINKPGTCLRFRGDDVNSEINVFYHNRDAQKTCLRCWGIGYDTTITSIDGMTPSVRDYVILQKRKQLTGCFITNNLVQHLLHRKQIFWC